MTNFRLLLTLATLTTCSVASGQYPRDRDARPTRFPHGLQIRRVAHEEAMAFEPQAGAAIFDEGTVLEEAGDYLHSIDSGALPADCGYACPPAWAAEVEAFYLNREGNDRFTASSGSVLTDFDYEKGLRVAIHRHRDCLDGWDLIYTGGFDWNEANQVSGAGLNPLFVAGGGINLSAFNNAATHSQSLRSRLHSVELNRMWYGWDVISVGLGVRYLNVEEDYFFGSVDGGGNVGMFDIETNNNAGGVQLALEMKVPMGRWTSKARAKGGLFMNLADSATALSNAGVNQLANSDDDVEFSSLVEFGYFLRYRLAANVSIQAGYEVWWLYGMAVAPDQLQGSVTPLTGLNVDSNGDTWYHGGTAGVEIVY